MSAQGRRWIPEVSWVESVRDRGIEAILARFQIAARIENITKQKHGEIVALGAPRSSAYGLREGRPLPRPRRGRPSPHPGDPTTAPGTPRIVDETEHHGYKPTHSSVTHSEAIGFLRNH